MESKPFIWATVDAALDMIIGISWNYREFPRFPITERKQMCGIPIATNLGIAECEMSAAVFAIVPWSVRCGLSMNIALRTDNRNVLHWLRENKAKAGKSIRLLKFAIDFVIKNSVGIISRYLRSAKNVSSYGLARWSGSEIADMLHQARMMQIGVPSDRIRALNVAYTNEGGPPRIVEQRGQVVGCIRNRFNKVCEWRPGRYAAAGLLWGWGHIV